MTKRIVSGVFLLIALGALGLILAGALTSGEQLIVRFLTAIIVAALGLYVISDLRLQANDNAVASGARTTMSSPRVTTGEQPPPNSTAAFMATVTGKRSASTAGVLERTGTGGDPTDQRGGSDGRAEPTIELEGRVPTDETGEEFPVDGQGPDGRGGDSPAFGDGRGGFDDVVLEPSSALADTDSPYSSEIDAASEWPFNEAGGDPATLDDSSITDEHDTSVETHRTAVGGTVDEGLSPDGVTTGAAATADEAAVALGDFLRPGLPTTLPAGVTPATPEPSRAGAGADAAAPTTADTTGHNAPAADTAHDHTGDDTTTEHVDAPATAHATTADPDALPAAHADDTADPDASATAHADDTADPDALPAAHATAADTSRDHTAGDTTEYGDGGAQGHDAQAADSASSRTATSEDHVASSRTATSEDHVASAAGPASDDTSDQDSMDDAGTSSSRRPSRGLEAAAYADEGIAPIIDLRLPSAASDPSSSVDQAIQSGELEVISSLIEQGLLSATGPISDRDVRTMVYVAFTSSELRKILLAGGTVDGDNSGLDLGDVEVFPPALGHEPKALSAGPVGSIDVRNDYGPDSQAL